jgi:hypothetical protein
MSIVTARTVPRPLITARWIFPTFLVVALEFLSGVGHAAEWATAFPSASANDFRSVRRTSDGGLILAGSTESCGGGRMDAWIVKLDADGKVSWDKAYGGYGVDFAVSSFELPAEGYLVAGNTSSLEVLHGVAWILKLDAAGAILWQRTYRNTGVDILVSAQGTTDGGSIFVGRTEGPAGTTELWVVKLGPAGEIQWEHTYGGTGMDIGTAVRQTPDGGYVAAGTTTSFGARNTAIWVLKLKTNGDVDWQKMFDHAGDVQETTKALEVTPDGGILLLADTNLAGAYPLLLKLTPDGGIEWQRRYTGPSDVQVRALDLTPDGGCVLAGEAGGLSGHGDAWLLRTDAAGEILREKTFGDGSGDVAWSVQAIEDGAYLLAGHRQSSPSRSAFAWVAKLDTDSDPGKCGLIGASMNVATSGALVSRTTAATVAKTHVSVQPIDLSGVDCPVAPDKMCPQNDPDLQVVMDPIPTFACPGDTITVNAKVSNSRPGVRVDYLSAPTTLRFLLSKDGSVDPTDVVIGEYPVPYLPPDGSCPATISLMLPRAVSPLSFVVAEVDPANVVVEADETNNTASRAFVSGADLIVTNLRRSTAAAGSLTISGSVKNQGPCTADPSTTKLYVSDRPDLQETPFVLGDESAPSLSSGDKAAFTFGGLRGVSIPASARPGLYYLNAKADAAGNVAEINEANNFAVVTVAVGPDLVVSNVATAAMPLAAANYYQVHVTVSNVGDRDAAALNVTFYKDLPAAPALRQAGDFTCSIAGLKAGDSESCGWTYTYEHTASHTAWIQVDAEQYVAESDEGNNVVSISIK